MEESTQQKEREIERGEGRKKGIQEGRKGGREGRKEEMHLCRKYQVSIYYMPFFLP